MAELLQSFVARCYKVSNGIGVIKCIWVENSRAITLGLKGRRTSGIHQLDFVPTEVADEPVARGLKGLSAFQVPRLIRWILRGKLSSRLRDYDMVNSQAYGIWDVITELGRDSDPEFQVILFSIKQRQELWGLLKDARSEWHSDSAAKSKVIEVMNMCSYDESWPQVLKDLYQAMARFYKLIGVHYEELMKIATPWQKRSTAVTLGNYLYCNKERLELDKMDQAVRQCCDMPASHVAADPCPEADGLAIDDPDEKCDAVIKQATTRPLKVKPYPQDMKAVITLAAEKYPGVDWTTRSRYSWDEVQEARKTCQEALDAKLARGGKGSEKGGKPITCHTDFALVVAAELESRAFWCQHEAHVFDTFSNHWTIGKKTLLDQHITKAVQTIFATKRYTVEKGRVNALVGKTVHPLLKDHGLLVAIRLEVGTMLEGHPPVYDRNRHLIQFNKASFTTLCRRFLLQVSLKC